MTAQEYLSLDRSRAPMAMISMFHAKRGDFHVYLKVNLHGHLHGRLRNNSNEAQQQRGTTGENADNSMAILSYRGNPKRAT